MHRTQLTSSEHRGLGGVSLLWASTTAFIVTIQFAAACNRTCPSGLVRHGDFCGAETDAGDASDSKAESGGPESQGTAGVRTAMHSSAAVGMSGTDAERQSGGAKSMDPSGSGGSSGAPHQSSADSTNRIAVAAGRGGDGGAGGSGQPMDAGPAGGMATAICGNGILESSEKCDGNCPSAETCKSSESCLVARLKGDPTKCDATCEMNAIENCVSGDNCCPAGCTYASDTDCSKSCGDGVVESPETCEPSNATKPCPISCDDGDVCTMDILTGSAAQCTAKCSSIPITSPTHGDGCCPPAANAATDSDCKTRCGDGVLTGEETCDNGAGTAKACPTSCDDGDPCTMDVQTGSPTQCNMTCTHPKITGPAEGDGCCPASANAANDSDCKTRCGDGVVSSGETCDDGPGSTKPCPGSCEDRNPCTSDRLVGSASTCDSKCEHPVAAGATCDIGKACTSSGNCETACGNGAVDRSTGEECDRSGGSNKWECTASCKSSGLSKTTAYVQRCDSDSTCAPQEHCAVSLVYTALIGLSAKICIPRCSSGRCALPDGFKSWTADGTSCNEQGECLVACRVDSDCPDQLKCEPNSGDPGAGHLCVPI